MKTLETILQFIGFMIIWHLILSDNSKLNLFNKKFFTVLIILIIAVSLIKVRL